MTLDALRELCVTPFPLSNTRPAIMAGLEQLLQDLINYGISADVWIDGSFLTEKIDPKLWLSDESQVSDQVLAITNNVQ